MDVKSSARFISCRLGRILLSFCLLVKEALFSRKKNRDFYVKDSKFKLLFLRSHSDD